jgi:hypothetical protein
MFINIDPLGTHTLFLKAHSLSIPIYTILKQLLIIIYRNEAMILHRLKLT